MKLRARIGATALTFAALSATAGGFGSAAFAEPSAPAFSSHAVFVETDATTGKQVAAYSPAADGTLALSAV